MRDYSPATFGEGGVVDKSNSVQGFIRNVDSQAQGVSKMREKLGKVDITFYGLDHEKNGAIRADVFAQKLTLLVNSLGAADKHINGRKSLNYLISYLGIGSAIAQIVEVEDEDEMNFKNPHKRSSVKYLRSVAQNIQKGSIPQDTPKQVIKPLTELSGGTEKNFSHGEIQFEDDAENAIRVDKSFGERAKQALASLEYKLYAGTALGSFDGVLKEVDLRGKPTRAKLITSIGGKELNCTCNFVTVDNLREALDKRVIVSAVEHYDGTDRLPKRIDIKKIQILENEGTLERWKGAFDLPYPSKEDVW